jgi:hypothetical protein
MFLFLSEHHSMAAYWVSGGIAQCTLNLGMRWRWVLGFTLRQLYSQGKSPWYPLGRRLGGPRASLGPDAVVKRKISSPCRDSFPENVNVIIACDFIIIIIIIIIIRYQPQVPFPCHFLPWTSGSPPHSSFKFQIVASYPMCAGFSFPGSKAAGAWSWTLASI